MLYPNLCIAMKKEGVTKTDLGVLLNLHINTVTSKLDGETTSEKNKFQIGFSLSEAMLIKRTLFKSYDLAWLFEFNLNVETNTA